MARQLKSDLQQLKQVFTKNHNKFRVLSASVDELTCRFILKNETFFDIQANITVSFCASSVLDFYDRNGRPSKVFRACILIFPNVK